MTCRVHARFTLLITKQRAFVRETQRLMGIVATRELVRLFPAAIRPQDGLAVGGACVILASNFALPFADSGSRLNG